MEEKPLVINLPSSKLTKKQVKKIVRVKGDEKLVVELRYDDDCGNGHNSFAITGDLYEKDRSGLWVWQAGGCLHDEIARLAPELKKYIKWHLTSSDGPMHYVANTVWHAGDRDCWGGKTGEVRAWRYNVLVKRKQDGNLVPMFDYDFEYPHTLPERKKAEAIAEKVGGIAVRVPGLLHEGKARDFRAARNAAVWPEATDEQLSLPKEELKKLLLERLPALMEEFKDAMVELGFEY